MDIEMVCLHCLRKEPHVHPTIDQGVTLIDLDSTLCDISGRMHLAPPEDQRDDPAAWHKFHLALSTDKLVPGIRELCEAFYHMGPVHLISAGRSRAYWNPTMSWLNRNGVRYDAIAMRHEADHDLTTFKARYVAALDAAGISVRVAVDDDLNAVAAYQEVGVETIRIRPPWAALGLTEARQ